ncbi:MAG: hypothetical protein EXR72_23335 [Myxococcales bacterium]|nr:hypothetical protein [Myxococcales bacterium]
MTKPSLPVAIALLWLAAPALAVAPPKPPEPPKPQEAPPVYVTALPAAAFLVAFLPVAPAGKEKNLFDVDLRVEVVLPRGCGDKLAGLMRQGGAKLDGSDAYDVVLERRTGGECSKDATRIGARWAIRMRVPDGATRELVVGGRSFQVARTGAKLTLDGEPATGDVPGAPPTAAPATLITGTVTAAEATFSRALPGSPPPSVVDIAVSAKWPKCAGPLLGLLGRGDAASHFSLNRFEPLASAPLDGSCGPPLPKPRRDLARAVVRVARFRVGETELSITLPPAPSAPPAASPPPATPAAK